MVDVRRQYPPRTPALRALSGLATRLTKNNWPQLRRLGPMLTSDPPEGRGEGGFWSRGREYEPETVVCLLLDIAAK
jgi:hypothetical protein